MLASTLTTIRSFCKKISGDILIFNEQYTFELSLNTEKIADEKPLFITLNNFALLDGSLSDSKVSRFFHSQPARAF